MLKLIDLKFKNNHKVILDNLNLNINDGEVHVLMGPNGAGKSTLMNIIMHNEAYKLESGKITYNEEDITDLDTASIAKKGIFLAHQDPVSIDGVSLIELLRENAKSKKQNIIMYAKELNKALEEVGLSKDFASRGVNEGLSGGEKKKSEIAQMLLLKPRLILLDEIDSGLDVDALKNIVKILKAYLKETNASLLMITHNPLIISSFENVHVHVLDKGHIIKSGSKDIALKIAEAGFNYEA